VNKIRPLALLATVLAVSCFASEAPRRLTVDARSPEAQVATARVREVEQTVQERWTPRDAGGTRL